MIIFSILEETEQVFAKLREQWASLARFIMTEKKENSLLSNRRASGSAERWAWTRIYKTEYNVLTLYGQHLGRFSWKIKRLQYNVQSFYKLA